MASSKKIEDPEDVINRLIAEVAQDKRLLEDIRRVIHSDPEFDGLSLVGGVKTILRRYREEKEASDKLRKELNKIFV